MFQKISWCTWERHSRTFQGPSVLKNRTVCGLSTITERLWNEENAWNQLKILPVPKNPLPSCRHRFWGTERRSNQKIRPWGLVPITEAIQRVGINIELHRLPKQDDWRYLQERQLDRVRAHAKWYSDGSWKNTDMHHGELLWLRKESA